MKLRNKQTGVIIEACSICENGQGKIVMRKKGENFEIYPYEYNSLAELNEEWEDVPEEPKEYWFLSGRGEVKCIEDENTVFDKDHKSIGNYFESREEAELAVRKLKAFKRLKDKGFRPKMWEWEYIYDDNISGELIIKAHIDDATDSDGKYTKDLDLLFCPEENI